MSNPAPGENLVSGNLVMETGCIPITIIIIITIPIPIMNIRYNVFSRNRNTNSIPSLDNF